MNVYLHVYLKLGGVLKIHKITEICIFFSLLYAIFNINYYLLVYEVNFLGTYKHFNEQGGIPRVIIQGIQGMSLNNLSPTTTTVQ